MHTLQDPEFGNKMVTLMAALVLVLQIAMVGQRWIVTNIRIFAVQSFLLAAIAGTIAWFNHAPHIYIAAVLTLLVKVILAPVLLERLGLQRHRGSGQSRLFGGRTGFPGQRRCRLGGKMGLTLGVVRARPSAPDLFRGRTLETAHVPVAVEPARTGCLTRDPQIRGCTLAAKRR